MRCWDNKGRLTLYGLYLDAKKEAEKELAKYPDLKKRTVTYREFSQIIRGYFDYVLKNMLKGYGFDLHNRMGEIRIVKTKLTRYTPNYYKPKEVHSKHSEGYWHHLFWFAPKKWRMSKLNLNKRWRAKMMNKVNQGFEFPEYTENRDGYIYKVK